MMVVRTFNATVEEAFNFTFQCKPSAPTQMLIEVSGYAFPFRAKLYLRAIREDAGVEPWHESAPFDVKWGPLNLDEAMHQDAALRLGAEEVVERYVVAFPWTLFGGKVAPEGTYQAELVMIPMVEGEGAPDILRINVLW